MQSQKKSILTQRKVSGSSKGRGPKGKILFLKESIKLNWNFQRDGSDSNQKIKLKHILPSMTFTRKKKQTQKNVSVTPSHAPP